MLFDDDWRVIVSGGISFRDSQRIYLFFYGICFLGGYHSNENRQK